MSVATAAGRDGREISANDPAQKCPALAAGVQLVGPLQDSGFKEQQWLILRNQTFLQVSELLYRVAELCDGRRTTAEIAAEVTDTSEWTVKPEHVELIVKDKLAPLALIASDETGKPSSKATDSAPDALAVNLRTPIMGPRLLNVIAEWLRYLFHPFVLAPVLVTSAAAHVWLYLFEGLGSGLYQPLYHPEFLLLALLIAGVASVFHELGHAAALSYAGGRSRGMGGGFYLVFPALYTDVTESYRLRRWARVRVDLGGIYFHLLFALGTIGAYAATGEDFLLLVAVLLNFEMIRQLLPFVRLDGYWVLADLSGVPDFISQTGPFLRSVAARRGRTVTGTRLPQMKTWAKVAFIAYLLAAIPALFLVALLLLWRSPPLVARLLDALEQRVDVFVDALQIDDLALAVATAVQVGILLLVSFAVAYLFYALLRGPVKALFGLARRSAAGAGASALVLSGAAAVFLTVWWPRFDHSMDALNAGPLPLPPGVERFLVEDRAHSEEPITYLQSPPVGGPHSAIPMPCRYYDEPVPDERAVHSLEHGAVWITYTNELEADQREVLRRLAEENERILVSPHADQSTPIVATAWSFQMYPDSLDDPRLAQFIAAIVDGSRAPEPGAGC